MNLKPHQLKILEKRYFTKDETTYTQLCMRVAYAVAEAEENPRAREENSEKFFQILHNRQFLPNTPTWINAGLEGERTLSACFVLPLEDTMESILDCSYYFGMVQKFGGGTGVALSKLRPKGTPIKSTHGKSCGPVRVLKYLAATSQMITQGGARDGANMAVLDVYHKDVMEFINLKSKESKYMLEVPKELAQNKINSGEWTVEEANEYVEYCRQNGLFQLFNVSVAVDHNFMEAVRMYENTKNNPEFARTATVERWEDLLPCGESIAKVWDAIINQAWASGDPGLLFIDRAREINKLHTKYDLWATNPCGEQFLPDFGSCNLGSIDLSKFVVDGDLDEISFRYVTALSVRFLDNIVSINKHPLEEIRNRNNEERRIGLGIMGWADYLLKRGIPYCSERAIEEANRVGKIFKQTAHDASGLLAYEKGPFPLYKEIAINEAEIPSFRRNATVTTVAPTGTISIVAGCSSGIEPHFLMAFDHQGMREHGGLGLMWASETLEDVVSKLVDVEVVGLQKAEALLKTKHDWKPANEIDIKWHVRHQSVWQKYIDNSISKTLNLPNTATVKDIADAYLLAYNLGCKGSTVFRDGCKPFQVLSAKKEAKPEVKVGEVTPGIKNGNGRPKVLYGKTEKILTPDGKLFVTLNLDDRGKPYEIFANLGKAGGKAHAYTEALGRIVSLCMRYNIPVEKVIKELRGISSGDPIGFGKNRIFSVPDGLGAALESHFNIENEIEDGIVNKTEDPIKVEQPARMFDTCPDCKVDLIKEEGCHGGKCINCGYSKC